MIDRRATRRLTVLCSLAIAGWSALAFGPAAATRALAEEPSTTPATMPSLREIYSRPPEAWPAADWDEHVLPEDRRELGKVPKVEFPADNPYTREKAMLGWRLFFDPRLSSSGAVACVSCHHPDLGWSDGKTLSQGHQLAVGTRNAPTVMGAAFSKHLMWDGRADSLEDQALLPLGADVEMHTEASDVEKTLGAIPAYVTEFREVFGTDKITIDEVTQALATFTRTIVPGRSRFDAFLNGRPNALTDQEVRGLDLFRTKARCINCHNGPLLTDGEFHNIGLTYYGRKGEDLGRYKVTKKVEDVGAFKTPTLRNIVRTAPLMHNGAFELPGVLNLYNVGMPTERVKDANDPLWPKKSPILKPLKLTVDEKADLTAFLDEALREPKLIIRTPVLPGLYGASATTLPALPPAPTRGAAAAATKPAADDADVAN